MKVSELKKNIGKAINRLDHSDIFVCHAGDTDSIVADLQKVIGDRNNNPTVYVRWSVLDWRRIPHLQKEGCKDCQDMINKYIDKCEHILFVIKDRVGHYTMREWFYSIQQMRKKSPKQVYVFVNRDSKNDPWTGKIIDEVFIRGGYALHKEYGSFEELIALFDKVLEAPIVHDALNWIREAQAVLSDSEIKPYKERIDRLYSLLDSDKTHKISTYLPERLLRKNNPISSVELSCQSKDIMTSISYIETRRVEMPIASRVKLAKDSSNHGI